MKGVLSLICLTLLITSAKASIILPTVVGKIVNHTKIPSTELGLELSYYATKCPSIGTPCTITKTFPLDSSGAFKLGPEKFKGKGIQLQINVNLIHLKTKKRLDIDSGMDFIYDPQIILDDSVYHSIQKKLYVDFFTEIHFYDWSEMSLNIRTPNEQTFETYVKQVFVAKGFPELQDDKKYSWEISLESASYVISRSNNQRYHRTGLRHYYQSLISPSVISKKNEEYACDTLSYDMCIANQKTNYQLTNLKLKMGWDNDYIQKEYGFLPIKAYNILDHYKFVLKIDIVVYSKDGTQFIHTFALNEKQSYTVSAPEESELLSMSMQDIFVPSRDVNLLDPGKVIVIK